MAAPPKTRPITIMYGHTYSKSMDQPGKVASPARGQLNRKNECFPVLQLLVIVSACLKEPPSRGPFLPGVCGFVETLHFNKW